MVLSTSTRRKVVAHTIFVTGGTGFIGSAFVPHAIEAGYNVQVLTRSEKSTDRIRGMKAEPIIGDLNIPGHWQDIAAKAQIALHLAQPETYGERVTQKRAEKFRDQRLKMDANLLDCLQAAHRILYVGGTSYYGDQGLNFVDEDTTPKPNGWGPYIAPAIEALAGYVKRGLPIIEAFPSWVYGTGSWFAEYQLEPMAARKTLISLMGAQPTISVVHVEDVARALLHLIDHGEVGKRYFITDDRPVHPSDLVRIAAQALDVPVRMRRVPIFLVRLFVGPIIADSMTTHALLSNHRLKETGFTFNYPTSDEGVPDAIQRWQKSKAKS
jgi:nucleoside-diphosphate-sugar epimerase